MYKFFKEKEIVGLNAKLVQMLDRAREYAGVPFILTSTVRTIAENNAAGGVEDSSHLAGLAVDIRAKDSVARFKIMTGLIAIGFNRIGIYEHHIHADIDTSKAGDVMWYSKIS